MQLSSLLVPRAFANLMLFRNLARLLNERLSMELQQQRNAVACTTRFNDLCVDIRRHVRRTNKIIEMHARQCIALLECLVLVPWAASMLKAFGPTCVGRVDGKISFNFHFSMRAEPHCEMFHSCALGETRTWDAAMLVLHGSTCFLTG